MHEQLLWAISSTRQRSPDCNEADILNEDLQEGLDLCLSGRLSQREELGQISDLTLAEAHYKFEAGGKGPNSPFRLREKELHADNTCILFGSQLLGGGHMME